MSDDELLAAIASRGERSGGQGQSGRSLLITGALFLALGGFFWGWEWVALVAVAIFLHEIGHVIAMRIFGYKNVRMLFIPLLGGLASGEPRELDATKNALVSLAGPAFGMFVAWIVAVATFFVDANLLLVKFAWVSVLVNGFNLLPFVPLDGGQFANEALFSRHPKLEMIFRLLAVAGLGWFAWNMQSIFLGVLALFTLILTQPRFRHAKAIKAARDDPAWRGRTLDRDTAAALRAVTAAAFLGMSPNQLNAKLPALAHGIWLEINKRFPGPGATVALILGYLLLVGGCLACGVLVAGLLQPAVF